MVLKEEELKELVGLQCLEHLKSGDVIPTASEMLFVEIIHRDRNNLWWVNVLKRKPPMEIVKEDEREIS